MARSVQWDSREDVHEVLSGASDESSSSSLSEESSEELPVQPPPPPAPSRPPTEQATDWESFNARLRHETGLSKTKFQTLTESPMFIPLNKFIATVFVAVMDECLSKIIVTSKMNKLPQVSVNIEYVPLEEKYLDPDKQEGTLLICASPGELQFHKFKRDVAFIIKVLKLTVESLKESRSYTKLMNVIKNDQMIREQEQALLNAKLFAQKELVHIKKQQKEEKKELLEEIRDVTRRLGKLKDLLNVTTKIPNFLELLIFCLFNLGRHCGI